MAAALPQIATFSMKVSATDPTTMSLDIVGRSKILVDRVQAFLRVEPKADGTIPTLAAVQLAERLIRAKVALDRNFRRVITNPDVPLSAFQQLQGGPLPVPPFELGGNEQPTLQVNWAANFLQMDAVKNYGDVYLEFLFYGQEA